MLCNHPDTLLVQLMDMNAILGRNVVVVPLGKHRNNNIFSEFISVSKVFKRVLHYSTQTPHHLFYEIKCVRDVISLVSAHKLNFSTQVKLLR